MAGQLRRLRRLLRPRRRDLGASGHDPRPGGSGPATRTSARPRRARSKARCAARARPWSWPHRRGADMRALMAARAAARRASGTNEARSPAAWSISSSPPSTCSCARCRRRAVAGPTPPKRLARHGPSRAGPAGAAHRPDRSLAAAAGPLGSSLKLAVADRRRPRKRAQGLPVPRSPAPATPEASARCAAPRPRRAVAQRAYDRLVPQDPQNGRDARRPLDDRMPGGPCFWKGERLPALWPEREGLEF